MKQLFLRLRARLDGEERGITGLETAIVLIAFVIVASVFAYVVLSAGLYASQKTKQAVNSGLESTMSVIELKGDIIAKVSNNSSLQELYLFVGIPAAGHPVDFIGADNVTKLVTISYADDTTMVPSANWTLTRISSMNNDNLLDENELFMITVDLSTFANIGPYHDFTLSIRPPDGPTLSIDRRLPGRVSQYANLH